MFRTVTVNRGNKLSVTRNRLVVTMEEEDIRIPLEDIYSVIVDNPQCNFTVPALTALTEAGAHVLLCNEKHVPVTIILPENRHYHPLTIIRKQMDATASFKNAVWDRVVVSKISNQAKVLELCGCRDDRVQRLVELAAEVEGGDIGNREGIAAKLFFRTLYGSEFIRMHDDATNAALNYGYAIIRSAVSKTLCAYGFNCVLGIHHISESNPFNLTDDLMEPFRPVVDYWVDRNGKDLLDELTVSQRNQLAALVNELVFINGRKIRIRNAIDEYVKSFSTAMDKNEPEKMHFPEMVRSERIPLVENDD